MGFNAGDKVILAKFMEWGISKYDPEARKAVEENLGNIFTIKDRVFYSDELLSLEGFRWVVHKDMLESVKNECLILRGTK